MKKTILLLFATVLTGFAAHAQKIDADKVPAAVVTAFNGKFPQATKVVWEQESSTEYEATFKLDGKEISVNLDNTGKWLETETEIKVEELPAAVRATLEKEFAGYKTKEASKIESAKNGNCFEAEIEKGGETMNVLLSAEGTVLGKAKMEDKEDKD